MIDTEDRERLEEPAGDWESRRARIDERRRRRAEVARRRRLVAGACAAIVAAVALVAAISLIDGEDGQAFDAEGFVEAANEHGAGIELGDELFTDQEDKEIYGLILVEEDEDEAESEVEEEEEHHHTGGSLSVLPDERSAESEIARCRTSLSLLCFRAANVVIALEGDPTSGGPQRLAAALARLAGPEAGMPEESG